MNRRNSRGFTLLELAVALAMLGLIAALTTPNIMDEINIKRANSTIQDTQSILDAARAYRVEHGTFPGASTCTNALTVLRTAGFLPTTPTQNRYNQSISTKCDARTFSVVQRALPDWDSYLVNALPGTVITNAGTNQITSTIGIPGTESALSELLHRSDVGNPERNRMRTTLRLGNNQIHEAGNIHFSVNNPTLRADTGNLHLSSAGGDVIIPAGQKLVVDDIEIRSRGNRRVADSMGNYVQIGTYVVQNGWLVRRPSCPNGGVPKAAMRPATMRGGWTPGAGGEDTYVGRYGFAYYVRTSGANWVVTAISDGAENNYANQQQLIDVYCFYSN